MVVMNAAIAENSFKGKIDTEDILKIVQEFIGLFTTLTQKI